MSEVNTLTDNLRSRLTEVFDVESALEQRLADQEQALLAGDPDAIVEVNRDLDDKLGRLRSTAEGLKADTSDLARALTLEPDASLVDVIAAHPDRAAAAELKTMHTQLVRARRSTRSASSKNAAIARTSLDAIASVRGILSRAMSGEGAQSDPMSRLDTEA